MSQVNILLSFLTLLLTYVCETTAEKHLPSYIVACSKSAADFDECCTQHGQAALPTLIKGDKEYDVPLLSPMVLPSIEQDLNGFKLSLRDSEIQNLDAVELKKVKFDLNKNELYVNIYMDSIALVGKYKCDGQLLILRLEGDGNLNVTLSGVDLNYHVTYKLEEKDGDQYIVIPRDADIKYTMKRAYFDLQNLFGGNEQLSKPTLAAINEEWDKFIEFLQPTIIEVITEIVGNAAVNFFSNVPLKNVFLD